MSACSVSLSGSRGRSGSWGLTLWGGILYVICALPEYWGKDICSMSVKWSCDLADCESVEASLVATLPATPLCKRQAQVGRGAGHTGGKYKSV